MQNTPSAHVQDSTHTADAAHNHTSHKWLIGTALVAGAVILSPYVLPAIGIGSSGLTLDAISALHGTGVGSGLAGIINSGLNAVPLIGGALSQGGAVNAAVSAATGIGGVLLGRFVEKKSDGSSNLNWGKIITYGALMTSALIALPSVLTGISIGIVFLCGLSSTALASSAVTFLSDTVGTMGIIESTNGASGAAALLPHLLTCGVSLLPTALSFKMSETPKQSFTQRLQSQPTEAMSYAR